jgi:hypothetical protein
MTDDVSNMYKHIRMMHPFCIPPAAWNRNKLTEYDKFWSLLVAKKEKTTEPVSSGGTSVQTTLSAIPSTTSKLSISTQLELICEAISIGFLPLSFASYRGLYRLIEGYNNGKYPHGLGDWAIKSNIHKLFNHVNSSKERRF